MLGTLIAVIILFVGGTLAMLAGGRNAATRAIGPGSAVAGCGLALCEALRVLWAADAAGLAELAPACQLHWPWHVPLGSLSFGLDPLSAWFAAIIALVGGLAAVYGGPYLRHQAPPRRVARSWFAYNLLLASMMLVVTARNGVLFLVAWETMSLASWLLVMFDARQESVRRAGWTYLVATHLGTAFLMALFAVLGRQSGTLDFDRLSAVGTAADAAFLLALVGFGTKAGLIPLHVWLPEAHPAAPSHVSAVMSGVMIKTGIYGLLRVLTLTGPPPEWWGWTLLAVGAVSAILGVLFALAQHDLKRLLAYHSVENMGIITLGLGVGLLGLSTGSTLMAVLGLAGGLLHVANHAVFKSLLFLGSGAVLEATGTREIDRLGGLLKRMPVTGLTFLIGSAAICGLPPLNGFMSELLVYLAAFTGLTDAARPQLASWVLLSIVVIGTLALVGGLAVACFTKAFGVIFLGEPRTPQAAGAREVPPLMRGPLVVLAGLCVLLAAGAPWLPGVLRGALAGLLRGLPGPAIDAATAFAGGTLYQVALAGLGLLVLLTGLLALRSRLLAGRPVREAATWDCGYASPSPRMQYTASSFAAPLVGIFKLFVRVKTRIARPQGLFPSGGSLETHTPDMFTAGLYRPLFRGVSRVAASLRWLQQGRIQLYVLYIAVTLLALLIWKLG